MATGAVLTGGRDGCGWGGPGGRGIDSGPMAAQDEKHDQERREEIANWHPAAAR